ncbi:hypothetical protein SETIT_1G096500v2 [Setaria italica]|uniref:Cyclin-like domain-containing protein n=2 Tax=Setaria italica TaxID=4555 RepID=A0A368PJD9_SETIT|nr:cyclin-T1-1 [Setaria italica]RCV05604.1 hypothetical protein SETIT_1G096500v2 [Setaria italica]
MDGDAWEGGGGRARSWYLSREEIERGSPSRRDGVGAAKEAELRATYCCFIRDVCTRLQLPQITVATAILLCHRFYLRQSHAKNEWQTIATVCIFLASKIEDTPCLLKHVVIAAYETMYRKNPDAAKRIHQEEVFAKQKDLILVGETLLLSTIRFDFNIQHPYEPLKLALKNLGICQKEVRQRAMSFINDTLPTTLVVQFKPHFIAAGSLFHAAKFHNFVLPSQNGKVWWNEFDVAPKQLQAVIQQMSELLFKKRDPCSMVSANKPVPTPIPTPTPMDKHQIKPPPTPALMDKQTIKPIPTPTLTDRQQKIRTPAPALRHTQSSMRSFSSSNTKASSCVTVGSSFDKLTSSSASNEENRYRWTDEENQYRQRTDKENQYRRTNEQNQYRWTDEQNQHRRTDEQNQYRRRTNEENQHRRTYEQNQHRRTYEENQHRQTYEENQHRRMNEEKQCWRVNEEKQCRQTNEENQYRRTNEENQYQRTHTNHNLVPVDQRIEKPSYRGTLKVDRGYRATIIMDLTRKKRRIQEVGRFPAPVYISDTNDWRIGSLKKQKLERR